MMNDMTEAHPGPPTLTVNGSVARIRLRRPQHRNRLQVGDLEAMRDHLLSIESEEAIKVVVIEAEVLPVRPVFCSGFHLGDFDGGEPPFNLDDFMVLLENMRAVTICALNGSVYGGASDFPMVCDITVAARGVHMRMPTALLGLHYHYSGLVRYVNKLGVTATKQAFLTAEPIGDDTLLRVGYVTELVPAEALAARVDELAKHVASLSPLALTELKRSINEIAAGSVDQERMEQRVARLKTSEDFAEGRRAFSERRPPVWKGR